MKISINSVNFLEFFASFLYDTGKLFRFEKSRHFRSKKREVFIRKYVYLYERLIFSAAFVAGTLCIARKKGLEVMNLIQTNSLSARQAEQILALLNECQKTQPIHISFPFEDGNCFLLLLDESETLAAIMGMILPPDGSSDEEPVECIAFTRPSLRRRGYFAALLEKACDISGEHDILFPVDPESADTAATMKAIHADRVDQEYQMKWDFDPAAERFDSPMVEKRPLTFTCTSAPEGDVNESVDPDSCWDCFHSADDPDPAVTILTYEFLETPPDPMCSPAAVCMARMQPVPDVPGTFHACFYGFRVHDLCRGLGIGEAAFCLVLNDLIARGCTRIVLHVSSDNYPALSIYKKAGFRIIETLSYFMY